MKAERETFTNGNCTIYIDRLENDPEPHIWLGLGRAGLEIRSEDLPDLVELLTALKEEFDNG